MTGAPPRQAVLVEKIREIARNSRNVIFTDHASERMEERDINTTEVLRVLQSGYLKGRVENGKSDGEYVVKIVDQIRGRREAGVVTVVKSGPRLVIVTVEWEDM